MSTETQSISLSAAGNAAADRRDVQDRRRHSWRTVTFCGLHGRGRRRQARRQHQSYYLDHYDSRLVFTGLLVLLLSCVDALLTLTLLDRGAYETNYLMARLLEIGNQPFVVTKIAITATGVLFLLMHAHFRILRLTSGKSMLQFLACVYGLLIAWEIVLIGVTK